MKAPRLLAVVAVVLALGLGFAVLKLRDARDADANPATASASPRARDSSGPSDSGVGSGALEALPDSVTGAASRSSAEFVQGRPLEILLKVPAGAPRDVELSVVVLSASALERTSARDRLEQLRSDADSGLLHARASFGAGGAGATRARLMLPEELEDPRLLLDGRYLYLERPVAIDEGAESVELEAELGACVVVQPAALGALESQAFAGKLQLAGRNFGGRGGGIEQRELDLSGAAALEFRAVDSALTWSLIPDLDQHHAAAQLGLELEAGEERTIALSVGAGGRVSGVVVGEAGEPLEGVEVRVQSGMPWFGDAGAKSAETDAQGRFALAGVAPGQRDIEARSEGWRSASQELEVAEGQTIDDLRIALDRGEAIGGVVRWPDGQPAAESEVLAESLQSRGWGGWGQETLLTAGRATSDGEGRFRISGLEQGSFIVRASRGARDAAQVDDEDAPLWRARAEGVQTGSGQLVLELAGPVAFRGLVVDDRDEPLRSFTVEARPTYEGGAREPQRFEDEQGSFLFERAGPGEWRVRVTSEGHVSAPEVTVLLSAGDDVPALEFQLDRTASIAGRVLDPFGAPAAGAEVSRDEAGGNPWTGNRGPRTESDAEGNFLLEGLTPGTVELSAAREDWADSEMLACVLAPGEARGDVELGLRIGGSIVGTVSTPDGEPMAGRRVTWGSNAMGFGSLGEVLTDAAGQFAFEHVTPGEWAVTAAPSMGEMGQRMQGRSSQTAFVDIMGELVTETVDVVDGEVSEVYLGGVPRQPVRIFGVVSRAGEALEGAQVYAVSEGSAVFEGMKTTLTEGDGSYELLVDRPGSHVISAELNGVGVEAIVDVPVADEARVDLAIPLGLIEGVVKQPDGSVAAGVRLSLQREDGLGRLRWNGSQATADEDGRYAFDDLEAGTYTVRANTATWGGGAEDSWGTAVRAGIEVERDAPTLGVDFQLEAAGSVKGSVVGPGGKAVARATVFFRDSAGRLVSSVSGTATDAAGQFEAEGLAPGDYTLSVRAKDLAANDAGSVRVSSGQTVETELVVESGALLVVTLEDEQGSARRARIEVFDDDGVEVGGLVTLESLRSAFNEGASSLVREVGPLPLERYTVRATTADGAVVEKSVRLRAGSEPKTLKLVLED